MNVVSKLKILASWMSTLNSVMIIVNRIKTLISEILRTKDLAILLILSTLQIAVTGYPLQTITKGLKKKKEEDVDHVGTGVKEAATEEIAVDLPISTYANFKISVSITILASSSITVNRTLF